MNSFPTVHRVEGEDHNYDVVRAMEGNNVGLWSIVRTKIGADVIPPNIDVLSNVGFINCLKLDPNAKSYFRSFDEALEFLESVEEDETE